MKNERMIFMKPIKLIIMCLGIFVCIAVGFMFFADRLGFEFQIAHRYDEIKAADESGMYKLVEMRSEDDRYVTLSVVQIADENGKEIDHRIVYTVNEIPVDTREPLAYSWFEGTKDFCINMSFGYYRYAFEDGTWIVYKRQDDFSLAPLKTP